MTEAAPGPSEARLMRSIGATLATAIVVNSTIGTGIFQRPATVAREAGSLPLATLVWVVGALFALSGALSVAELGTRFPRAGGLYEPIRRVFGPSAAFLFGWAQIALLAPSAIGSFCLLAGGALAALGVPAPERALSLAVLFAVVLSALAGARLSGAQQSAITLLKYLGVSVLAVVGLTWAFDPLPAAWSGASAPSPSAGGFVAALLAVMWAYDGWADLLGLAGEVRAPERTVPRALVLGTLLVAVVYLAVSLGAARVLGLSGLRAAGSGADMAAMRVAELTLGGGARTAMSALIFVSATGGAMASVLTHSRAFVPMASDGTFFRSLGEVSERGVPARAVVAMGVLGALYVLSSSFEQLTDAFVVGYYPFYALAVVAMLRLRQTDGPAPFAAPLQPLWATIFLALTAILVIGSLLELDVSAALAFGVLAAGVPVSFAYRAFR